MRRIAISETFVQAEDPIRQALISIDHTGYGIALVVENDRRLIGTITDGDIRGAILNGTSLDTPVSILLQRKIGTPYEKPLTAPAGQELLNLVPLMQERGIRQVPLLNEKDQVVDLVFLDDLLPAPSLPIQAMIMAGGYGTRLRPLTEELPKPLLPVGDRPLMELIIQQLQQTGIRRVNVATHYLTEKIVSHFGDGKALGVEIRYVTEDRPLGTAGALSLLEEPTEPILVINGDILTRLDFRSMLSFHRKHKADLTAAVRQYDLQVPYGVMECDGPFVRQVLEKPQLTFLVNAGIYLLEPSVYRYIPSGERFDMTDLIQRLIAEGLPVVSFPVVEYWLDIGRRADYEQAQEDAQNGRFSL